MDKQEYLDRLTEIGTCESDEERRALIAEIHSEAERLYDSNSELSANNTQLENDMESLRAANMKLFLQVGERRTPADIKRDETGIKDEPPKEKRNFTDLFNEKGEIK